MMFDVLREISGAQEFVRQTDVVPYGTISYTENSQYQCNILMSFWRRYEDIKLDYFVNVSLMFHGCLVSSLVKPSWFCRCALCLHLHR